MNPSSVAVLGLGEMGGGMAHALLRAGFDVAVFNRTPQKAAALVRAGASLLKAAAEAGRADVLVLSLADENAVESVLFGEVAPSLTAGTVVLDTTTVSPSYARRSVERLAETGVRGVEVRVVGNADMARAGQLRIFTGGDQATVDSVRPLLSAMGKETHHLGPAGHASALKLALNLLLGVQTAGLAEAARLADAAGIGRDGLLDVVLNSGWRSPVLAFRAERMRRREYEPAGFRAELMHKDLDLAMRCAEGMPLPLTSRAAQRYGEIVAQGRGDEDAAVLVELDR